MAKTVKKSKTKSKSKRLVASRSDALLSSSNRTGWGKDQPMVLVLSAGIILLIAVTLFLTGWL